MLRVPSKYSAGAFKNYVESPEILSGDQNRRQRLQKHAKGGEGQKINVFRPRLEGFYGHPPDSLRVSSFADGRGEVALKGPFLEQGNHSLFSEWLLLLKAPSCRTSLSFVDSEM